MTPGRARGRDPAPGWGLFEVRDDAGRLLEIHVMPCRGDEAEPPHRPDWACDCDPRVTVESGYHIFIHKREH